MKKILLSFLFIFTLINLKAQNAFIGGTFSGGWGGVCNSNANFGYLGTSAGTSFISDTLKPTGTIPGDHYWRMAVDWGGTIKQITHTVGSDVVVSPNTIYTLNGTCTTSGALKYNVTSSNYRYIFKTNDAGSNPSNQFLFFEIDGTPISVNAVSQSPTSSNVYPGQTVTVTATLTGSLPAGQGVYIRYTTNSYSTSTVVAMTGSGTTYTYNIPAASNTASTTYSYYIFTSGNSGPASNGSDADFYTINLNNNGGSNYGYTVKSGYNTISAGNYSNTSIWATGALPPSNQPVILNHSVVLDMDITPSVLTNAATFTLSIPSSTTRTITGNVTNNGTITVDGTLIIAGGGITNNSALNINGTLQINAGGYISTTGPTYAATSNLVYNTGGSYSAGTEWYSAALSGTGIPQNVTINSGTSLNFGTNSNYHQMLGDLNIDGSFALSTVSGGDLKIKGNFTRAAAGTFTSNCREVEFNGTSTQAVQVTGGGTETFNYLKLNHTGTFKPSNASGSLTNIIVTESACSGGAIFSITNSGTVDLNGQKIILDNLDAAASPDCWIYIDGARTITNSAGINNGEFAIQGQGANQPTEATISVHNNSGTGSLVFDNSVMVSIADGYADFGISGGTPMTTIQGILQVKLGGSVGAGQNACVFAPNSILRFANTVDYQVGATDKTWASGSIYSGAAGIPYNVEILNAGTDLTINDTRALRGNLDITNGSLTLNTSVFNIGGNWSRSGASSVFTPNTNKVVFDGNAAQTITCTANSNTETFYDLEISANSADVSLSSTKAIVNNSLTLTTGNLVTGANEVFVNNSLTSAITGHNPIHSATSASYINGNLRRKVATGIYDFPVGNNSNYEIAKLNIASNSNVDNILTYFTTSTCSGTPNFVATPTNGGAQGVVVNDILNGGQYKIEPFDNTLTLVTSPTINYAAQLTFNGHSNGVTVSGITPGCYTLVKRPSDCSGSWDLGGGSFDNTTQLASTSATAPVTATLSNLTSFSTFGMGFNGAVVLPLTFLSFTGTLTNNHIILDWKTIQEKDIAYFEIEKSNDGVNYVAIGTQKSTGNPLKIETTNQYTFVDNSLLSDFNYYKIKTVSTSNVAKYSDVICVKKSNTSNFSLTLAPNVVSQNLIADITVKNINTPIEITIYSVKGELVFNKNINVNQTKHSETIAVQDLETGIYFIKISNNNGEYCMQRFIKQ